jgi:inner membrane protein
MPTIFSHTAVGFVAAKATTEATEPNTWIVLTSMVLAALPDADALFLSTIPYNHPLGHRGFTHSLVFAAILGIATALVFSKAGWVKQHSFWLLAIVFSLVTASHGFFDAMTDGGLGVAFLAPFTNHRYFFPWRPIPVAPLSAGGFISPRGLRVIAAEAALFWPFALAAAIWNRKRAWRLTLAGACVAFGITMWILALK